MLPIARLAQWFVQATHVRESLREPDAGRRPAGILRCVSCSKEVLPGEGAYDARHREAVCGDPVCAHQQQADALY